MTSREIIRRIVDHDSPPRLGWSFALEQYSDIIAVPSREYLPDPPDPYGFWGRHEELLRLTGFDGEVFRDRYGNIYGRLGGVTKGECIRGAIQDWDDFDRYRMPVPDARYRERLLAKNLQSSDKYVLCTCSSLFSQLRDARLMANALADTLLEPEMVTAFLDRIAEHEVSVIQTLGGCGIDAIFLGDDWGTQDRTFISPESFEELFAPAYKRVADAAHAQDMKVFMHSCGRIYGFMEHFINAGIDVFQFDQPDIYPSEVLAGEFAGRAAFWSPVDIQKVLPTGDREIIERRALEMCEMFRRAKGGWIAMDYGSYGDIGVKSEWAGWARDLIINNSRIY